MEAIGIHLASKAQKSTIGRWFTKQKPEQRDLENGRKNFQGGAIFREPVDRPVQSEMLLRNASSTVAEPTHTSNHDGQHHSLRASMASVQASEAVPSQESDQSFGCGQAQPDARANPGKQPQAAALIADESNVDPARPESPQVDEESTGPQAGEEVIMVGLGAEFFTETSPRIVVGSDGFKPCPVVLLSFDLSNKIQEMINFNRLVLKQDREAQAKLKAIADFKPEVSGEILNHQARIARVVESMGDDNLTGAGDDAENLDRLRGELSNLLMLEEDVKIRGDIIESNVLRRLNFLREHWADVNGYLEQAFVISEAIEPASDEDVKSAPRLELQEECQNLVDQMREFDGGSRPQSPLETGDTYMTEAFQPPTEERRIHIEASKRLEDARDALRLAQEQFERRQDSYKLELRQNMEAELRGDVPMDASIEDFDLRWVVQDRKITRELLEAENAVSTAKLAAQEVGLDMDWRTQSSCFPDDMVDGSPELASHEPVLFEHVAGDPRMIAWQKV